MEIKEIQKISDLQISKSYYSRSMDIRFTVLEINKENSELLLGIRGKTSRVSFLKFNRAYLSNGIVVD